MREILIFVFGMFAGGTVGVLMMCLLQVGRLSEREEEELYEKAKNSDSVSIE